MKAILILILLTGGIFVSSVNAKTILRDAVVFKVARKVFSLSDLKVYYREVNSLKCIYNDSLLVKIFGNEFSKNKINLYNFQYPFSKIQKDYFLQLIDFAKLMVYSEAQTVVVKPGITKYFFLTAKGSGCSLDGFNEKGEMKPRLKEVTRLEIFARSRFLPSEKSGVATKDDIKKAIISAKNLMKSIGKQIDDELYWK